MLKNIIFALLSLVALAISPAIFAADEPANQEAIPAEIEAGGLPIKAQAATITEPASKTVSNTRPDNDNHTDYRYCLELKTNPEIAACRYKKR